VKRQADDHHYPGRRDQQKPGAAELLEYARFFRPARLRGTGRRICRAPHMSIPFEGDAFISYAHLDNVELVEGHKGWVANLHLALEKRVAQLYGEEPRIWWDPKLQGNDYFADTLVERLQRVKSLIAVVSPRYVKSEWGRRELTEFCKAAEEQGGIRVHDKARIFKVLKTPVPRELHPPELQALLGYEFFKVDEDTGKPRELDAIFGPEAETEFWLKLDDLAHDICDLIKMVPPAETVVADPRGAVYLAVTTSELKEQREAIRRDLIQHGTPCFRIVRCRWPARRWKPRSARIWPAAGSRFTWSARPTAWCRKAGWNRCLKPRTNWPSSVRPKRRFHGWCGSRPAFRWRTTGSAKYSTLCGWIRGSSTVPICSRHRSKTFAR
jgi:hypothetical protein